jgi:prepilin-type N-terminal cleavage/methylation domain-containing protein/prepilin-type processing-associated H-X9-DG protein
LWEDVKMKKAFTLIELLVVIAIIAILAAMLMPSLTRARAQAKASNCRGNIRQMGLALGMFRTDNVQVYPGWANWDAVEQAQEGIYLYDDVSERDRSAVPAENQISPEIWVQDKGGPWFQLVDKYIENLDVLDDPGFKAKPATTFWWGEPRIVDGTGPFWAQSDAAIAWRGSDNDRWPSKPKTQACVSGSEYGMDIGRVHKNSNPGRVLIGCFQRLQHEWGANYGAYPYAHQGGSNVLYVDGAVQWAPKQYPDAIWGLESPNSRRPQTAYFEGYIPNPRKDEDAYLAKADSEQMRAELQADIDDIFVNEVVQDPARVPAHRFIPYTDDPDATAAGVQWDRDYLPSDPDGDPPVLAPTPGNNCASAEDIDKTSQNNPYRPYSGINAWYQYEQRGIFATEPRWNKEDAMLRCFMPWDITGRAAWHQIRQDW